MFCLLLVLLAIRNCIAEDYPKCCDSESVLLKVNSTYTCVKNNTHRIEIITNITNHIEAGPGWGYCIDVDESVGLFRVNGTEVTKEEELEVSFYPKCCPLNYFYNTTTHGCVKSKGELGTFFQEKFVKVGLPQCKIIMDINLQINSFSEGINSSSLRPFKESKIYNEGLWCADRDENDLLVARICQNDLSICDRIKCIHKCCPDGQSFVNGSFCRDTYVHGVDLAIFSDSVDYPNDSFAIIHGHKNPIYLVNSKRSPLRVYRDGTFMQYEIEEYLDRRNVSKYYKVEENSYCIEHAVKNGLNNFYFFRGFPEPVTPLRFSVSRIAMVISSICLFLTVLYYCLSNEKRTVFGKTLISYCSSCLIIFLILTYIKFLSTRPGTTSCVTIAFCLLYTTLATFTWMNVMCVDIYWTFGSSKSFSNRQPGKELKRIILYSLYGWGVPLIFTVICLIFYHVNVLPPFLQVYIDQKSENYKCKIYKVNGNYAQLLFVTTPEAIFVLCNLVLFVKTAISCLKVKKEISKMNDNHGDKGEKTQKLHNFWDRFGLLLKLFLVMGVSFVFEAVSDGFNFRTNLTAAIIELVWDTFNSLQGFWIFLIFVAKKRVLKKFRKNVGLPRLRKFSFGSSALTQTTSIPTINSSKI